MLKLTTLLLTLTSLLLVRECNETRGQKYELKGHIIREVNMPPHCGVLATAVAVEFDIQQYSDDDYPLDSIAVIFTCPEFYGEAFFEVERTYKITVADENQADFGWSIENYELLDQYPDKKKLWVIQADKLED